MSFTTGIAIASAKIKGFIFIFALIISFFLTTFLKDFAFFQWGLSIEFLGNTLQLDSAILWILLCLLIYMLLLVMTFAIAGNRIKKAVKKQRKHREKIMEHKEKMSKYKRGE